MKAELPTSAAPHAPHAPDQPSLAPQTLPQDEEDKKSEEGEKE
ncbi:hypothetical protein [Streptomyces gibsoniae]|uniref:Uncharacterized protein n=1 Tax=Streptomyces gibsoniae TaxID=3075529 RepID=A0ABU2U6T6_9ACTN|nr:hypothetical protein [Streptomyces sp. DSM 41699]MDT0468790.1 hypothetical protein [Streptomyces sp. DSM 41699]